MMVTEPTPMPFTGIGINGAVVPWMKKMVPITFTLDGSLFWSVTDKPPEGAGVVSEIGNVVDCPTPTVKFAGKMMLPGGPVGAMFSVRVMVATCTGTEESATVKVRGRFTAEAVGVPLSSPDVAKVSPAGSVPEIVHAYGGVPPLTTSVCE